MISFQEIKNIDLRVGEINEIDPISGSHRMLKVQVDLGSEQRNLVTGLAAYYEPQQLIGQKVIVVLILESATIHGVLSEGMRLGAGCNEGKDVSLLTVNKDVPNGTPVE